MNRHEGPSLGFPAPLTTAASLKCATIPGISVSVTIPRECKSPETDQTVCAGYAETPFGRALFAETPRGLCHLSFLDPWSEAQSWTDFLDRWPRARILHDDRTARDLAERVFLRSGSRRKPLPVHLSGTPFQLAVWRVLLAIPEGEVTTYSEVARAIGHPTATRATGTAIGKNPVAWVIPCHRVIRRDGVPGNYRWGPDRKLAMLEWERVRHGRCFNSTEAGAAR